jgi:poly(hydroxyalkanoate) depolymerase family esterase
LQSGFTQAANSHEIEQPLYGADTMIKSLTKLWFKNLRRVSKVQQAQGRKIFTSMLTQPVRALAVKRAKPLIKTPRPVKALKSVKAVRTAATKAAKPRAQPSAAPVRAATVLPGRWLKSFFSLPGVGLVPGRRMMYWLYLPSGAAPAAPRPLVVMLHGCQQTANDFAASTRMNELAERKGFAVLYPQQSTTADRHRCWHWYKHATQQGLGDVWLIAEMVKQVQGKYRLDTSRTYVAGMSAGAGMAAILALRHPQLIAAAGLHSAPVFGTSDSPMGGFQAMQQGSSVAHQDTARHFSADQPEFPGMPVMLIQGKNDPVVRRVNLDHLTAQFAIINSSFISKAEPVQRSYAKRVGGRNPRHGYKTSIYYAGRKPRLVKCEIDSLGHAWSGGDGSVAYSSPEGPDATLLLWTFFARQQRPQNRPAAAKRRAGGVGAS